MIGEKLNLKSYENIKHKKGKFNKMVTLFCDKNIVLKYCSLRTQIKLFFSYEVVVGTPYPKREGNECMCGYCQNKWYKK